MTPQTQSSGFRRPKLAIALLALVVLTAQAPRPSPFVSALDEIVKHVNPDAHPLPTEV